MSHQITLDNHTFTLIHRTNKKIKRISLALENKNEIIVKTPLKFKSHMIKEIVYEYKEWILKSIQKVPSKNSFDFVSGSLVRIFDYDEEPAQQKTVEINDNGSGIVALMPFEIAEQKGVEVLMAARSHGFPLQVRIEQED